MQNSLEQQEAVIVFDAGQISRQMQYVEFEAVMDGYVPMADYAGKRAQAVYIRVNPQLKVTCCVFFLADFNEQGMINHRWNVPLQQLADSAASGPDLGAGPVRLACFSQCPMDWQQHNLWDPCMEPGRNSFVLIRKAVASNRLGLIFAAPAAEPAPAAPAVNEEQLRRSLKQELTQVMRKRLAQTLKNQRLHIRSLNSRAQLKIENLKRDHQQRLSSYKEALQQAEARQQDLQEELEKAREALTLQQAKADSVREYYEHKLRSSRAADGSELQQVEDSFRREMEERLKLVQQELQQQLDMKEMELFYRQQRETALADELEQLRKEHETLLNHGGDQLLMRMQDAGISFVAYEPGAGQMTLPLEEVGEYMQNPRHYAAAQCGLDPETYILWLDHYHSPYCNAVNAEGEECGKGVTRIQNPRDFHDGESNRCSEHQHLGTRYHATQG